MDREAEASLLKILEEIREGQKQQIAKQIESLKIQRASFELIKEQYDRANKIQDRAEKIQASGAQLVSAARKSAFVVIPIIVLLLMFLGWIILRIT